MSKQGFLKSFVQRNRKLTRKQQMLLENTRLLIKNFKTIKSNLGNYQNINLDIGFGKGEYLIDLAINNPNDLFIGAEPFLSGVLNVLNISEKYELHNIKVFNDDVRILLTEITEEFFNKIYILFPDPWPKARHHKRRIINPYLLNEAFKILKKNGQIHIITDSDDYALWIEELFANDTRFKNLTDQNKIPISSLNTSFFKKAQLQKNNINVFAFCKNSIATQDPI